MQRYASLQTAYRTGLAFLMAIMLLCFASAVRAQSIRIAALGASNTAGNGVGASAAWPAQLEGMLRAKGYNVSMTVEALSGDSSAGILGRVASIPAGTQIVLYDAGTSNDRRLGVSEGAHQANAAQIASQIRARGAVPIKVVYAGLPRQPDRIHLTAAGHATLAARLLPQVIAAGRGH